MRGIFRCERCCEISHNLSVRRHEISRFSDGWGVLKTSNEKKIVLRTRTGRVSIRLVTQKGSHMHPEPAFGSAQISHHHVVSFLKCVLRDPPSLISNINARSSSIRRVWCSTSRVFSTRSHRVSPRKVPRLRRKSSPFSGGHEVTSTQGRAPSARASARKPTMFVISYRLRGSMVVLHSLPSLAHSTLMSSSSLSQSTSSSPLVDPSSSSSSMSLSMS